MKIAVSAAGASLDAPFDARFGRCSHFIVVDTETLQWKALSNDGAMASGGAGIQAAQMVVNDGVEAVVTGHVGPNAYQVLAAAKVTPLMTVAATVREAVEQFKDGRTTPAGGPTAPGHFGTPGRRFGRGGGRPSW